MGAPARGSGRRLVGKVLLAAVSAATAVGLGLTQAGVWQPSAASRVALVTVAAAVAFTTSMLLAVGEWRGRRTQELRDDVALVLTGAAWAMHDLTGLDVRELGLAVYRLRRERLRPWRRLLVRVHRERAARRPATSGVVWRPGKGVIGKCVALGADVRQDVGADAGPWLEVARERWPEVPEHVRAGLDYDEFVAVRGKYHVVVATPVIDDLAVRSRVLGCVALDGPEGSFALLGGEEVGSVLVSTAAMLRRFVY